MASRMNVILLGPPGAGKGTQAKALVDVFDLVHLSSGDMLRAERSAGSALGQKVADYMNSGQLVPDELVTQIVFNRIREELAADAKGVLLDGFPRTLVQAEDLDAALKGISETLAAVIDLKLDDSIIIERMAGRRSCPKCGQVYHIKANPPKDGTACTACGAQVVQRDDDAEPVVRERLDVYRRQTQPLEDYYQRAGLLEEIDAGENIDSVRDQVQKTLRCSFEK